jgi:hypothetical protein
MAVTDVEQITVLFNDMQFEHFAKQRRTMPQ